MHTTLAFMTLCKEESGDVAGDHVLMTHAAANSDEKTMIWHWAVARLLLVMYEHDLTVIKSAHHIKSDAEVRYVSIHISIIHTYALKLISQQHVLSAVCCCSWTSA
jgi:hypothetical protein